MISLRIPYEHILSTNPLNSSCQSTFSTQDDEEGGEGDDNKAAAEDAAQLPTQSMRIVWEEGPDSDEEREKAKKAKAKARALKAKLKAKVLMFDYYLATTDA